MKRRTFCNLLCFGTCITGASSCAKRQSKLITGGHTNFDHIFLPGYEASYDDVDHGESPVSFTIHSLGELHLVTGKLIACDPLFQPDLRYYFEQPLPSGHFQIQLSLARLLRRQETRIAAIKLTFTSTEITTWHPALIANQEPANTDGQSRFGVDSGVGGLMDFSVAQVLSDMSFEQHEQNFCGPALALMEKNRNSPSSLDYANVVVNRSTGANVILFSSGWGDGGYVSYWGYDSQDKCACLVTDFDLFFASQQRSRLTRWLRSL